MKVELSKHRCVVIREAGDPVFRNGGWAGEYGAFNRFLYHVQRCLKTQGHDIIKRRLQSDGHLMGDERTPYLREKRHKFYVYDSTWAISDLALAFNKTGRAVLMVQDNEGGLS